MRRTGQKSRLGCLRGYDYMDVISTTSGKEEIELRRDAYMDVGGRTALGASSRAVTERPENELKKPR